MMSPAQVGRGLVFAIVVVLASARSASTACDCINDTVTTVHLRGDWLGRRHPLGTSAKLGHVRLTVSNTFGPFTHPAVWSGRIGCTPRASNPGTCPGRAGKLRNITLTAHGVAGRDSLITDFDADVTFDDTGISCHLSGVSIGDNLLALSSFVDCTDADSAPILQASFDAARQGPVATK